MLMNWLSVLYLWILEIYTLQSPAVQTKALEGRRCQARTVGECEGAKVRAELRYNLNIITT